MEILIIGSFINKILTFIGRTSMLVMMILGFLYITFGLIFLSPSDPVLFLAISAGLISIVIGYYFSKRIGTFKRVTDSLIVIKIGSKEKTIQKQEILYISRRSGIESFYSYYSWVVVTNRSKYRILGRYFIQNEPDYDLAGIFKNMGLKVREYGI